MKNWIIEAILAVAVVILFILHFAGPKESAPVAASADHAGTVSLIDTQMAYVDIDSLVPNYQMYIDLTADLQAKQNQKEADLNTKVQKFQKDLADFQNKANKGLETRAKLEEMGNALNDRQQQLAQLQEQYAMEIQEEATVNNRKVLQRIMDYLTVYNETHHLHYVIGSSFGGMLLYANPALNITQEVLAGLNASYKKE